MIWTIGRAELDVAFGDITAFRLDAICNSVGRAMRGGGGVDGAILKRGGAGLVEACRKIGFCEIGHARITRGFRLQARMVIHTSVPRWDNGENIAGHTLAECYRASVRLADIHGATSIGFPALGCGVRGFPVDIGASIAVGAVREALSKCHHVNKIFFICNSAEALSAFEHNIVEMGNVVENAEEWNSEWREVSVQSKDYWVNVYGMLQHHWALIKKNRSGGEILFINDSGGVFDSIRFPARFDYVGALKRNGFEHWAPGTEVAEFVPLPNARPHEGVTEKAYSSGKYWK